MSDLRFDFSAFLPSEDDLVKIREEAIVRARANKNCFTHWFPAVEALDIRSPRSLVIDFPVDLTEGIVEGDLRIAPQLQAIAAQIRDFGDKVGFPLFLKNSLCSAKHEWKETCYIESAEVDIIAHIANLTNGWLLRSNDHSLYLVAREMIPTEPAFRAFDGEMPITPEFRLFATQGKLNGWQPYWPELAIQEPSRPDWRERLAAISQPTVDEFKQMRAWAEAVTHKLGGYWSIDFLKGRDGNLWLIDMAEGDKSYRCEVGYRSVEGSRQQGSGLEGKP